MSQNALEQLRGLSQVVADTGDIEAVKKFKPVDCTTNPTLVLKTTQDPAYGFVLENALREAKATGKTGADLVEETVDRLAVGFGHELTKVVPGRVSTEVNADLSFDAAATVEKARRLMAIYKEKNVGPDRILIKIAATWEGIKAAETLEKEGIQCNLTLVFSLAQAIACGDANVFLISPFVGRILDWHAKNTGKSYTAAEDPGVLSVQKIYAYYKKFGYKTLVMAASFRNIGEIIGLAGCDRLTIAPKFLEELAQTDRPVSCQLTAEYAARYAIDRVFVDEKAFRWTMNQDAMATEKLAEGIRGFAADLEALRSLVRQRL